MNCEQYWQWVVLNLRLLMRKKDLLPWWTVLSMNDAMFSVLADEADRKEEITTFREQLHGWLKSKLSNYRREFGDGKHIFYVDTQVWYDYEVPQKIKTIK